MGNCSTHCADFDYETQNAGFSFIQQDDNSVSITQGASCPSTKPTLHRSPSRKSISSAQSSYSGESLTTCMDFPLLEQQRELSYYVEKVKNIGKLGAVRDFMEGRESAVICWVAFSGRVYMEQPQIEDFFEHCLQYVDCTNDASLRSAFHQEKIQQMTMSYITIPFGPDKKHVNHREFWCLADRVQAAFDTEATTSCYSQEEMDIGFWRKQSLIKSFYLTEDVGAKVIFKLFAGNAKSMQITQFQDMIRHSIMFFSQRDENELEVSGNFKHVVYEVCLDVLNGESDEPLSLATFRRACEELRTLFQQLIEVWKNREETQKEAEKAKHESMMQSAKDDPEVKKAPQQFEEYADGIKGLDSDDETDFLECNMNMENHI